MARRPPASPRKVVSGGQTGVDRAALDVALALGLEHGGWCPRGRRAEDGRIDERYLLQETKNATYAERTKRNVADSDATLVICRGRPVGGTKLTVQFAASSGRPCRIVDLNQPLDVAKVRDWLHKTSIQVLNVAGPRESTSPGIYAAARQFLEQLLANN